MDERATDYMSEARVKADVKIRLAVVALNEAAANLKSALHKPDGAVRDVLTAHAKVEIAKAQEYMS